jgi:RNA polymerase sigma-70 factor (ECF subfamily)
MESAAVVIEAPTSIETVYREQADRLWRSVFAFAGDADIASDAVAEAFAQAINRGDALRDPASWTWRAAFKIAAGALKSRRSSSATTVSDGQESTALDFYADQDLLAALQHLPSSQRAAVVLFYYADLSVRDIANRLGTNSLAVRANLSRGRKRLRELLGDQDV